MKFFAVIILAFSATAFAGVSPSLRHIRGTFPSSLNSQLTMIHSGQCTIDGTDPNCCWGGDQGSDACSRQNGGTGCMLGAETQNFCINRGITKEQCVSLQ